MQVTINNELTVEVVPNEAHKWLLSTKDVAEGYGLSESGVHKAKERYQDELIEGKHFLTVTDCDAQNITSNSKARTVTMWTKRGVTRLGFFLKTPMAKEFRDWAEDYIIEGGTKPTAQPTLALPQTYSEVLLLAAEQARQLELQAPKVEFYNACMDTSNSYDLSTAGAMAGLKTNNLPLFLRHKKYIYKHGADAYQPYQKPLDRGLFTVKLVLNNENSSLAQLLVTSKGVKHLRSLADEYDAWHKEHYGTTGKEECI